MHIHHLEPVHVATGEIYNLPEDSRYKWGFHESIGRWPNDLNPSCARQPRHYSSIVGDRNSQVVANLLTSLDSGARSHLD